MNLKSFEETVEEEVAKFARQYNHSDVNPSNSTDRIAQDQMGVPIVNKIEFADFIEDLDQINPFVSDEKK